MVHCPTTVNVWQIAFGVAVLSTQLVRSKPFAETLEEARESWKLDGSMVSKAD